MEYKLNVQSDIPDSRDWIYQPSLDLLPKCLPVPYEHIKILDQGHEGACTGFAIGAAINLLKRQAYSRTPIDLREPIHSEDELHVSTSMLYQMARRHDEWAGINYEGSSMRGAIQGWRHMGVCSHKMWPDGLNKKDNFLSIDRIRDARKNAVGAYYRVLPNISDFQAALNETGVVVVSAQVHKGWDFARYGKIKHSKKIDGAHAFIVVGYDETGFFVQNSWGQEWGRNGIAHWTYSDWQENIIDAWVFRLAPNVPEVFGKRYSSSVLTGITSNSSATRSEIAGHFVNIDEGDFLSCGKYWSDNRDILQTAELVAQSKKSHQIRKEGEPRLYDHIVFIAHSGMHPTHHAADRILLLKNLFKDNHIYPIHFMHDSGFEEEFSDIIDNKLAKAKLRAGANSEAINRVFEHFIQRPGKILWKELKDDMRRAFLPSGAGKMTVQNFLNALKKTNRKKRNHDLRIESCHLFSPALSIDMFKTHCVPFLGNKRKLKLKEMHVYNLDNTLERHDTLGRTAAKYGGSMLHLVSNVLEKNETHPTHDGFFTDLNTINNVINIITKGNVKRKVRLTDLKPKEE